MKECSNCKETKEVSEFGIDKYTNDGFNIRCKLCKRLKEKLNRLLKPEIYKKEPHKWREYNKKCYNKPEQKRKHKNRALIKRFGITLDDFERMLNEQDGVCKICSEKEKVRNNLNLSVDHCHKTGKVRGLLCNRCNRAIGFMEDNVQLLKNAIKYLENNK